MIRCFHPFFKMRQGGSWLQKEQKWLWIVATGLLLLTVNFFCSTGDCTQGLAHATGALQECPHLICFVRQHLPAFFAQADLKLSVLLPPSPE
jgi:hypothetical protein